MRINFLKMVNIFFVTNRTMGPENIYKDHEEREKWLMRSKNFESDV